MIRIRVACLPLFAVAAATASAQCYRFAGSGVSLTVNITSINFQVGPTVINGGAQTDYVFSGTNSLTLGGSTQTSLSVLSGAADIVYLPPIGNADPNMPNDVTTFTISVPNTDPPGSGSHSWTAFLAGNGNLIPSHLLPFGLPSISSWVGVDNSNYIELSSGASRTKIPITAVSSCSSNSGKGLGSTSNDPGGCHCGDPINIGTGNLFEQVVDYRTSGLNQLSFIRYYNGLASANSLAGSLGTHWRSNFDRYLRISSNSVVAERDDGKELTFSPTAGTWTTDTDADVKLSTSGSSWILTDLDDTVETYSVIGGTKGLLQSIQARNGYTENLQYNVSNQLIGVTDSFHRQLNLTYQNGLLQSVTTPDGLVISYGFIGTLLTVANYATSPVTQQSYVYENLALPNALTGIFDETGRRYVTWSYDSSGRALTSQLGSGADLTTVTYNDSDGSRNITNALGVQEIYKFATLQGVPKVIEVDRLATATTAGAKSTYTYDGNGYTASKTDWNGNLTTYVNDVHGQVTRMTEASGTSEARTTTTTYHATLHLPLQIVTPGLTTSLTYDSFGELLTKTLTDTTPTSTPYSTNGQTRTWTYTWSNFLPASVKGPRTDAAELTSFGFDSSGAAISITNALNQTIRVTQHLAGGLPQTIVDADGVTTNQTFDARQRLLTSTVVTSDGPRATTYGYDGVGTLTALTQPDGSAISLTYDSARRITGVSDTLGNQITYTLDALGDPTQFTISSSVGQQFTRSGVYDALGRVQTLRGGAGQGTTYSYDGNGNLLTVADPLGHTTQGTFDALNRLIHSNDPAQAASTVAYDAHNRPVSVTDPKGITTSYVYDGFGDLIQEVSLAAGTTTYRYDAAGNLIQKIDGRGAIANYAYDALDRRISVTYPGNSAENVVYHYDEAGHSFGIGRLTSLTDSAGTLNRTYDERGNMLSETRTHGAVTRTTSYTYDADNRIASITYPSRWVVSYTRDSMGQITGASGLALASNTPRTLVSGVTYQPFGPVKALTYGNGIAEVRTFDPDYRLTKLAITGHAPVENLTYGYDAADNVLSVADGITAGNGQTLGYDLLNRLSSAQGPYGTLGYTYDANGNRLTESSPATNDALGASSAFAYNQAGRLSMISTSSQPLAQYTYDAFGQRLVKVGSVTATTLYYYNRDGRLLEESDGQGNAQVDYVYLNGMLIATIQPSDGNIYFVHDDRLGTPQMATDHAQTVVWSSTYQPFGAIGSPPAIIAQDLRLPGQESDLETGLYHNGFRDYVPALGRYLQNDPIGLGGGLNPYAYVKNNPLRNIDLFGLCDVNAAQYGSSGGYSVDIDHHDAGDPLFGQQRPAYDAVTFRTSGDARFTYDIKLDEFRALTPAAQLLSLIDQFPNASPDQISGFYQFLHNYVYMPTFGSLGIRG